MDHQDIRRLVYEASPDALGRAMAEGLSDKGLWGDGDQGDCLSTLFSKPMFNARIDRTVELDRQVLRSGHACSDERLSICDILMMTNPPLGMLEGLKRFAKSCARDQDGFMPSDVAMVLYYTAIAMAWSRCGQYISDMDRPELREGLKWAYSRPWTPAVIRDMLKEGLGKLPYERD